MKKIVIVIILFCTLYSAYSLDYRQVIFGNSYKNILEIDADAFFKQYPEVAKYYSAGRVGINLNGSPDLEQTNYAHVYEQIIGTNTFYRVLLSYKKLTEADFLDWKNLEFMQFAFFKKSDTDLLELRNRCEFRRIDYNDNPVYTGLEIIERNNQVIGLMEYTLSESDSSNNRAWYNVWQNLLTIEYEGVSTISYATWHEGIIISSSNSLVDSRRPFMYTIQNAFDGNPATSYVENTEDDMFYITMSSYGNGTYDEGLDCTRYMIINGYASGDYYYQNNQIAKVDVGDSSEYSPFFPSGSFQLHDTVKPQVMNFEAMTMYWPESTTLHMKVEELTNGTRYNDTAMAEFDIYIENEGWLFGSSDTDTVVATPATPNEYEYTIKDDGTAEIKNYKGRATKVTIPSKIEYRDKTYTVTSIGDKAFYEWQTLTSITIPDSVTTIGDSAFVQCYSLTSITLPNSITSIGDYAFEDCSNLKSITIPNSITSIGNSTFSRSGLISITIPDSVTSIGDGAFASSSSLMSITIPNSVPSIGDWTFDHCKNLTSITIPNSVTSIGYRAFAYCENLTSVTISGSVTSIGDGAFANCDNLTVSVYQGSYALEYAKEYDIPYILVEED